MLSITDFDGIDENVNIKSHAHVLNIDYITRATVEATTLFAIDHSRESTFVYKAVQQIKYDELVSEVES